MIMITHMVPGLDAGLKPGIRTRVNPCFETLSSHKRPRGAQCSVEYSDGELY